MIFRPLHPLCILPIITLGLRNAESPSGAEAQALVQTVAQVDGQPITERLFRHTLQRTRSEVLREFAPQALGPAFWSTPVKGRIPGEVLKDRTLSECVRIEIQLRLAHEKGLLQHPGFDAILDELPLENQRRARAIQAGQVVHGPSQFTEQTYFAYRFSNLQIRLKELLGAKELAPDPTELKRAFSRAQISGGTTRRRVMQQIRIPALPAETAGRRLREIQDALREGQDFETVARRFNAPETPLEIVLAAPKGRKPRDPELLRHAQALAPGQTSPAFTSRGQIVILKCASRGAGPRRSMEEAEPALRRNLIDQAYTAMVEERIRRAVVKKNPKVWKALKME